MIMLKIELFFVGVEVGVGGGRRRSAGTKRQWPGVALVSGSAGHDHRFMPTATTRREQP